jgi:hypothetical protein
MKEVKNFSKKKYIKKWGGEERRQKFKSVFLIEKIST